MLQLQQDPDHKRMVLLARTSHSIPPNVLCAHSRMHVTSPIAGKPDLSGSSQNVGMHREGLKGLNVEGQRLRLFMQLDQFNQFTSDQCELRPLLW